RSNVFTDLLPAIQNLLLARRNLQRQDRFDIIAYKAFMKRCIVLPLSACAFQMIQEHLIHAQRQLWWNLTPRSNHKIIERFEQIASRQLASLHARNLILEN